MKKEHQRRIVILAACKLDSFTAKTAAGVIRYRRDEVVGVLDPEHVGQALEDLIGVGDGIPIVAELADLDEARPDMLVIGVATPSGKLPEAWRKVLRQRFGVPKKDIVKVIPVKCKERNAEIL